MGQKRKLAVFESSNISETRKVTPTKIGIHVCYMYIKAYTVQEYLHVLARVIFGEFVCEKQLADFILAI